MKRASDEWIVRFVKARIDGPLREERSGLLFFRLGFKGNASIHRTGMNFMIEKLFCIEFK